MYNSLPGENYYATKKDNNLVFFCLNCPMPFNKEGRVKIHNNNRNIVQNVY